MASNTSTRASVFSPASGSSLKWIVAGAALAGVLAAQSPLGIVPPTDTTLFLLATSALWAGWYMLRGAPNQRKRRPWRLMIAVLALLAVAGLSTALSPHWYTGLLGAPARSMGLAMWISLAGIVLWGAFNAGGLRSALMLAAPVIMGVELLSGLIQQLQGAQAIGTLSNSTFLGQVVVILLPVCVATLWRRGGTWRDAGIALAASTAALLIWFGSGAAGALASLFALSVLALRMGSSALEAPPVPATHKGAGALVGVATALLSAPVLAAQLISREGWVFERLSSRPYLWDAGIRLIGESPMWGSGPDSYRVAAAAVVPDAITIAEGYQTRSFGSLAADPHNLLVLLAVEVGLLGIAAALWLAFEIARNWARQTQVGEQHHRWFAWAALLGVATFALAPVGLQSALPLALVLGASLRPELPPAKAGPRIDATRALSLFAALALAASALVGVHAGARLWVQSASEPLKVAERASTVADIATADAFMSFWEARSWGALGTEATKLKALEAAAESVERDPGNPFHLTDLAFFLGLYTEDEARTLQVYAAAEALYPASLDVPLYRGRFLLREGELEAAAIDVERALYLGASDQGVQSLAADLQSAKGSR